uniref:Retrovirus-related Pol polyprotein from transposon TNT 1-94 n=2 Tax=Lygus hesperus TaxID=30085 RepID=A0A0A9YCF4_LYGHE
MIVTCIINVRAKATRKPFGVNRTRATAPLDILHTDVVGPLEVNTWDGFRYFVTVLDDYTHFSATFLLRGKNESEDHSEHEDNTDSTDEFEDASGEGDANGEQDLSSPENVPQDTITAEERNPEGHEEQKSAQDGQREPEVRSKRTIKKPNKLKDYILENEIDNLLDTALLTYREAVTGNDQAKWATAIEEEKQALEKNNTWTLVDKSCASGKKILSSRWVLKIKEDGRYKARLVVRGYQQIQGVDFEETYSPVVGSDALRTILALTAKNGYMTKKFDIKTAFLYGFLEEDIYMTLPEGYETNGKISKLHRALYGLKQAPERWNHRFVEFLKNQGLTPLKTDHCVFVNSDRSLFLAIYVDDGILIGVDETKMNKVLENLKKEFEMTSTNNPTSFLGMEIESGEGYVKITQGTYTRRVLEKFGMQDSKPTPTPLVGYKDPKAIPDQVIDYPYREAVGCLLYLATKTRPDISFAVGYCSRHMENPTQQDVANVKRIMRYLKGTPDYGITYSKKSYSELEVFTDSDFAGDPANTKSTSGYVIYFCGGPISWRSRKQPITATSSTEAEFISAAEACKELMYLKSLIGELTNANVNSTMLIDNQSTICLVKTGIMNRKRKHIDVKYHFLKEKFDEKLMSIKYCPTDQQIADILTKPLGPNKFNEFKSKLVN